MWIWMLASFMCTAFLSFLAAAPSDIQQLTFKRTNKPFPIRITELDQKRVGSRLKCSVECSKRRGCVAFVYKRAPSFCTLYRIFEAGHGTQATGQKASDITYGILNVLLHTYVGCHLDIRRDRALPYDLLKNSYGMKAQTCKLHCHGFSYTYFGTEFGRECWCGDVIKERYVRKPDTECNMPCNGDRSTMCGADMRISLYRIVLPLVP